MSSTERAPEPTMEDILASIRRIITDDETSQDQADRPGQTAQSEDEGLEGEADNQIIDDIARVLSAGGDAPANEDEEIMDLTAELGGLELVDEEPADLSETMEVMDAEPEFVEITEEIEEVLELDEVQPDYPEPVAEAVEDFQMAEPPAPQEPPALPPEAAAPEMPPVPEQPVPAEPKLSASEEAASALERAIAALKAGQAPAAAAPLTPSYQAPAPEAPAAESFEQELSPFEAETGVTPLPGDFPMAVPMGEQTPEEATHLDPEAESAHELESSAETEAGWDVVLGSGEGEETELVLGAVETAETTGFEATEPEPAPFWPPQASAEPEPEVQAEAPPVYVPPAPSYAPVQTNGAVSHDETVPKSLEDSIKDMLRPMLREWLDENMPRMIREELDSDAVQRGQD